MLPDERMVEAAWMSSEAPSMTHAEARAMTEAAFAALDRDALVETVGRALEAFDWEREQRQSERPVRLPYEEWRDEWNAEAEAVLRAVGLIA